MRSRRDWLMQALCATSVAPALLTLPARAAEPAPLDPNDPTAKALGFVTDALKVDASANGTFKAGQHCASCAQFQGKTGDKSGGCIIFTGRSVPGTGWCQAWTQRRG